MPSHLKAVFCPRNRPAPHAQPQAPSFITCEGLILSAAVAWLFINHSPGPIKRWLMVDAALSGPSLRCWEPVSDWPGLQMRYGFCGRLWAVSVCALEQRCPLHGVHCLPCNHVPTIQWTCGTTCRSTDADLVSSGAGSSLSCDTVHCSMTQHFNCLTKTHCVLSRGFAVANRWYHALKEVCGERSLQFGERGGEIEIVCTRSGRI